MYKTTTEAEKWMKRKPYETEKANRDIAIDWMIKEFGFYFDRWTISPELASQIIDNMGINRKVKQTGIYRYSAAMGKGQWQLSPQPIIFDENGKLMDGQHRLLSLIKARETLDFIVAIGVPHDTPIDTGLIRTCIDSLRIRGKLDERLADKECNAIINAILEVDLTYNEARGIPEDDKAKLINYYADNLLFAKRAARVDGGSTPLLRKSAVMAAFFSADVCGVNRGDICKFASLANQGYCKNDSQRSVVIFLKYLNDVKIHGGSSICNMESITEQALSDFIDGKPRKHKYVPGQYPYCKKVDIKGVIA